MSRARTLTLAALTVVLLSGCDDATGVQIADLAGFWNATLFQYDDDTGDHPGFGLDVVTEWNGAATLDVAESGVFTGTLSIPGVTQVPSGAPGLVEISGTLSVVDPDSIRFDFSSSTESLPGSPLADFTAAFVLAGNVLSFTSDEVLFDFPDEFEQSYLGLARGAVDARLQARFER